MKTISTLALALSLAVGAAGFATVADAATTTKAPAAAGSTVKAPILKKQAAVKPLHKKHKVMASNKTAPAKPLVKKS